MPATAFALSRTHSYRLGSSWHWRIAEAAADDRAFKVLIAFEPLKQEYRGWLGLVQGYEQVLLARLEHHATHKGWHVHCKRGKVSALARGVVKQPMHIDVSRDCGQPSLILSQADAIKAAFHVFNIIGLPPSPEGELPLWKS